MFPVIQMIWLLTVFTVAGFIGISIKLDRILDELKRISKGEK